MWCPFVTLSWNPYVLDGTGESVKYTSKEGPSFAVGGERWNAVPVGNVSCWSTFLDMPASGVLQHRHSRVDMRLGSSGWNWSQVTGKNCGVQTAPNNFHVECNLDADDQTIVPTIEKSYTWDFSDSQLYYGYNKKDLFNLVTRTKFAE